MLKYSDIIKNGVKKQEEDRTKDLIDSNDEYMKKLYLTIVDYLEEVRKLVKNDELFDIKLAVDIINLIIDTPDLIEKFYQSIALSNSHESEKKYLVPHQINVMACALKIGTGLKYSREELFELGLSALLYDVGLFKITKNILGKQEKLTEAESDIIKNHPEIGRKILSHFQAEHPMLPRVAHEHHERKNGSGYPEGLTENEICEYAKIIGLADTFDAMIHLRPYRKALGQYFSLKELIGSKNSLFSSKLIKTFLDEMGIFPIGCYVRLNNMEIGKVIATSKDHPLKPTIKMMFDSHGKKVSKKTAINLEGHPVLYVADAVIEEDLPSEQHPI